MQNRPLDSLVELASDGAAQLELELAHRILALTREQFQCTFSLEVRCVHLERKRTPEGNQYCWDGTRMSCLDLDRQLGRDGWAGDAVDAFHNNLAKLAFFAFAQVVGLVGWLNVARVNRGQAFCCEMARERFE
jgi:hypothetical protein